MRTRKIVSFSVVILLIMVLFAGLVIIPAAARPDTIQNRYNAQHTGDYSPVAGSTPPNNGSKWNFTGSFEQTPAVANGVVYVGSTNDLFYALNASTGAIVWSVNIGTVTLSSPAVANGVVYVGSTSGYVYVLNANSGAMLWNYTTGEAHHRPSLLVGTPSTFRCVAIFIREPVSGYMSVV